MKLILLTLLITAPGLLVSGESVITCDGDVHRLTCDTGLIMVTSTVYGRGSDKICSRPPRSLSITATSCSSSISTIADRCNGLRVCEVRTNSLNTSDPCKGIFKYYQTTYDCIQGSVAEVCEYGYRTLDCGTDNIQIINAIFGRADCVTCSKKCTENSDPKDNCYASNANSVVATLCNGKTSCTVEASSSVFSPLPPRCKETSKYLTVSYTCVPPPPPPPPAPEEIVSCEDQTASLTCGTQTIHIVSANFGRTDSTTCGNGIPSQLSNTNCYASGTLATVTASCEGQNSCTVLSSNSLFTDPCPGTYKYLKIEYTCV